MQYPGGKNLNGVYQRLINQIPPHRVYIETHLGSGAVMRHKRSAEINIGVDLNDEVLETWRGDGEVQLLTADASTFLSEFPFQGDEFVYVDPPYLASTRRSSRSPYRFDYTDEQHVNLLEVLIRLPCNVMVSGYHSCLYERYLTDWRALSFRVRTRSGETAEEKVWMNYPEPTELHDYRYLGESFREREKIRRKIERWKARLEQLPPLERHALLAALR
jgi:DNA adenine methylase